MSVFITGHIACFIVQPGDKSEAEAFVHELSQRVPEHGDALMIIAKGIQKGIQLGIDKGRNEGKPEVARTMLQNGIDRNTVMKMAGLSEDDLVQIRH